MLQKDKFLQRVFSVAAQHDIPNDQLLGKVALDRDRISQLLKGDDPSVEEIYKFADALNYPLDLLWDTAPAPRRAKLDQCFTVFLDMAGSSENALAAYHEMSQSVKDQFARGDVQLSDQYFRHLYRQSEVGSLSDPGTPDGFRDAEFT